MLPSSKPQAGLVFVEGLIRHYDSLFDSDERDCPVKVVARRAYYFRTMGKPDRNDRGIYDDALFIVAPDHFSTWNANTDPGAYRKGIANLEAPQVIRYRPGYHGYSSKWGHPAFRQASPCIVRRDGGTGNGKPLGDGRFTDRGTSRFWINLHRGGRGTTSSEGCQTVPPAQWTAFHACLTDLLKRHGVPWFPYLLTENPG